jgi:predicted CopG family antitoxin
MELNMNTKTIRISQSTYDKLKELRIKTQTKEQRDVSLLEIANQIISKGLPKCQHKCQ